MDTVINEARANASDLTSEGSILAEEISASAPSALRISEKLLAARQNAAALEGFPGTPPSDLEAAYSVQQLSLARWPDSVAGWKVGGIPEGLRAELGADWLVGPIFERTVKRARADAKIAMPIFGGGFAAIEPELIVQLGASRDQDRVFIGAEIASSPIPAINDYGPTAVICDFGNNNGLLIGAEIADWRNVKEELEVSIWIDGELIATRVLTKLANDALKALQFCLDHAAQQGGELAPGALISTGAITGIHEASVGAQAKISFGKWGELHLQLTQADRSESQPTENGTETTEKLKV